MLRASLVFFILAIFALLLGANGVAGMSLEVGKLLLYVFLALAIIGTLVGLLTGRTPKQLP